MTEPRVYTLELPAGLELLTLNQRMHWRRQRQLTAAIRQASMISARNAKIPQLDRVHILCWVRTKPLARIRDASNWSLSAKPAVDGLVDARVLINDDNEHVTGPDMRMDGTRVPGGQLVLEIRELPALTTARSTP